MPEVNAHAGLAGALPNSCCSLESGESRTGGASSVLSDPDGSLNSAAANANGASHVSEQAKSSNNCRSNTAAELKEWPCDHVPGAQTCSWGEYKSLTQPTYRRHAVLNIDCI